MSLFLRPLVVVVVVGGPNWRNTGTGNSNLRVTVPPPPPPPPQHLHYLDVIITSVVVLSIMSISFLDPYHSKGKIYY